MRPKLIWDIAPAYDMFISLMVLHKPNKFGVRGAWAKGVRSRLPIESREFLEQAQPLFFLALRWVYHLSAPRDGNTVLSALAALPPQDRLPALTLTPETSPDVVETLHKISRRQQWDSQDLELLRARIKAAHGMYLEELPRILDWWTKAEKFGQRLYEALHVYQKVFFAEEETRIHPALEQSAQRARELAAQLELPVLLEELSQGVRFESPPEKERLILAPSFWVSPLIVLTSVDEHSDLFLFGARPPEQSIVPGEVVPDALFLALKALADPTRLRILRYLASEPLTPTELSRRLRLRAPTVVHHLSKLRLAGLVYLTFKSKGERRYAIRLSKVEEVFTLLQEFFHEPPPSS